MSDVLEPSRRLWSSMRLDVLKPRGRLAKGTRMRYTIRALKLGEILDQAVKLTRDHFGVLIGITGILLGAAAGFVQIFRTASRFLSK